MALTDLDDYKDKASNTRDIVLINDQSVFNSYKWYDCWSTALPTNGTVPTSAVALDNTSTGAPELPNVSGSRLTLFAASSSARFVGSQGTMLLFDRLTHSGGLAANISTEQTTNLPTPALTRYTSGEGVIPALVLYAGIGSTATTFSIKYTNQGGTNNQVSPLMPIGGSNYDANRRIFFIPLAAGDTGVRSVESVTLTATTGTAGNLGIILLKPLFMWHHESTGTTRNDFLSSPRTFGAVLPEIQQTACLCLASHPGFQAHIAHITALHVAGC